MPNNKLKISANPPKAGRGYAISSGLALLALVVAGGVAIASPARPAPSVDMETGFRAAYPEIDPARVAPPSSAMYGGVAIDSIALPGLHLRAREDHRFDDGGVLLSYEDQLKQAQVVLLIAVAPDAEGARAFLDRSLRNVAMTLPRATDRRLGDVAWADAGAGDSLVLGVAGNIAYRVQIVGPNAGQTAAKIALSLRGAMPPGTPVYPTVSVSIPSMIGEGGAPIRVTAQAGVTPRLRADGGYVARGSDGTPRIVPFAKDVTVIATVTDSLGRVGEGVASATH